MRVVDQNCLELSRRDLKALVLDQLLDPVDDVEPTVLVRRGDVTSVQPAIWIDGGGGRRRVVQIAKHHLGAADQYLTRLAGLDVLAAVGIDESCLRLWGERADGAQLDWLADRRGMRDGAELGHPVALAHRAPESLRAGLLHFRPQRRGAREHQLQRGEVVLIDRRVLGERERDGRYHVRARHPVALRQLQVLIQVEPGHRHQGGPRPQP